MLLLNVSIRNVLKKQVHSTFIIKLSLSDDGGGGNKTEIKENLFHKIKIKKGYFYKRKKNMRKVMAVGGDAVNMGC